MTYALLALGTALLLAGVGLVFIPAAAIIAGCLCLALGYGSWRSDRPSA